MFKTIMALSALTLSFQAYSLTTKEFTDSFLDRLQENIEIKKAENSKYCDSFKRSPIYSELSYANEAGTRVLFYNIQNLEAGDFYKLIKNNFECYGRIAPNQNGSLFGAILNARAHNKDRELVRETLESMAIEKYEFYKSMGEVFGLENR